jgi:hypothetical protein
MRNRLTFFFIFTLFNCFSQSRLEWGIEYKQKIGFLVAHRGSMSHVPDDLSYTGELTWFVHTKGEQSWHKPCNYPTLGITLFGGSIGNNSILGKTIGTYGFADFPFVKKKHFELTGKLGAGLGYVSKVFDQEVNPKNVAMSTHLNALICFGLKASYVFNQNRIVFGIDATHMSNAAFKVPNLGVNLPYFSFGYSRVIRTKPLDTITKKTDFPLKKWLFGVTFISSIKEVAPSGGNKYGVFALSAHVRNFFRPKVGVELAFDVISKQAVFAYRPELSKTQWDILQMGVFAGYLFPLDRLHFVIGMGVYVKDKYQPEDFLYHRVGVRYYFKNGISTQVVLKSHWGRADYAEWGIGYTFNYTKK